MAPTTASCGDRKGAVTTLPEAPGAAPTSGGRQPGAINDRGEIVGLAYDAQGGARGFLFKRGHFTMIAGPAATFTRALDINGRGQVVGDYRTRPPVTVSNWSAGRFDLGRGFRLGVGGVRAWLR